VHGFLLTAAVLISASGCAVGPNFKDPILSEKNVAIRPESTAATDAVVADAHDRTLAEMDIPGQWWELFHSEELNELVKSALDNNPTLNSAQAALRQANEEYFAQRGSYWPSIVGSLAATRQKIPGAVVGTSTSFVYSLESASVNVSYSLDIFGGNRRQVEALLAQSVYQRYALEASYLSLTTNLVTTAIRVAELRSQIQATKRIAAVQQSIVKFTERGKEAGTVSEATLLIHKAEFQGTLAILPNLQRQLAQACQQLTIYVGHSVSDSDINITLDSFVLPRTLPTTIPSDMLQHRPDVEQSSALLHVATAQIGVATANMLPSVNLSGNYGPETAQLPGVFSGTSIVWQLAASIAQPIFNGGTLRHKRRAALAAAEGAAENFKSTVIAAFADVSTTLRALQIDADELAARSAAEGASRRSWEVTQRQLDSGTASHEQLIIAEQSYQNAWIGLLQARAQQYSDTIALFQALGGGWWNRQDIARHQQFTLSTNARIVAQR
jgi:NodT family efflux transporter outer membrane factor (OMF) lipoprotein